MVNRMASPLGKGDSASPQVIPPSTPPLTADQCIVALLLAPDREGRWYAPVTGRTRLQKELFLLKYETPAGRAGQFPLEYRADKFGPFSTEVAVALDQLIARRYVRQSAQEGSSTFSLDDEGRNAAIQLWKRELDQGAREAFHSVKANYNGWTLNALLAYVYSTYPSFTSESVIKDQYA